jgi:hypothetical protein
LSLRDQTGIHNGAGDGVAIFIGVSDTNRTHVGSYWSPTACKVVCKKIVKYGRGDALIFRWDCPHAGTSFLGSEENGDLCSQKLYVTAGVERLPATDDQIWLIEYPSPRAGMYLNKACTPTMAEEGPKQTKKRTTRTSMRTAEEEPKIKKERK